MREIAVGDRVTWTNDKESLVGKVVAVDVVTAISLVRPDGQLASHYVLTSKLTRVDVTPSMLAHDAAAARSDEVSVFAGICEDYEETMRWAGDLGDLGGRELV